MMLATGKNLQRVVEKLDEKTVKQAVEEFIQ